MNAVLHTEKFANTSSFGAPALFSGGEELIVAASAPCLSCGEMRGTRGGPNEGVTYSPAFAIGSEMPGDVAARDALLDRAMGPRWRRKSSEKLRRGRLPAEGLALLARDDAGTVVGTVRLWEVGLSGSPSSGPSGHLLPVGEKSAAARPASFSPHRGEGGEASAEPGEGTPSSILLLGPLAVDPALKSSGIGSALMHYAIAEATRLGHGAILLVGDAPYYSRFGFSADKTAKLAMPGPYEPHRFLALELADGALDGAQGVLRASGRKTRAARMNRAA